MKLKLKNYTPHSIILWNQERTDIIAVIPAEELPVRVRSESGNVFFEEVETAGMIKSPFFERIEIAAASLQTNQVLPPPQFGVFLIVSSLVAAVSQRADLLVPDTTMEYGVRDADGNTMGTTRFLRYSL